MERKRQPSFLVFLYPERDEPTLLETTFFANATPLGTQLVGRDDLAGSLISSSNRPARDVDAVPSRYRLRSRPPPTGMFRLASP
jgi:hypothetical protein